MRDDEIREPISQEPRPRVDAASPAPGRRTLVSGARIGGPQARLAVRLREAEGLLAAIERDHLPALDDAIRLRDVAAARVAALHLRHAREQVERDLRDAEELAEAPADREHAERLIRGYEDLRPRIDRALALAPPIPARERWAICAATTR